MVAPGGIVIYCVCTPLKAEGRDIVEAALASGRFRRHPVHADEVPGFGHCVTPEGDVLTLPQQGAGHDAFHVSRLVRV
jgi:16S rRNA (cytosine967-C5)-methyltransferase